MVVAIIEAPRVGVDASCTLVVTRAGDPRSFPMPKAVTLASLDAAPDDVRFVVAFDGRRLGVGGVRARRVAHLDAKRRARHPGGRFERRGGAVVVGRRCFGFDS